MEEAHTGEQQPPSSVLGEPDEDSATGEVFQICPPSTPALTLKEQLVNRERQRRIETERARWKRQFVLTNTTVQESDNLSSTDEMETMHQVEGDDEELESVCSEDVEEQTLGGESTKAHPDEESNERLGFNMERFLRNSDSFNPQLEPMNEKDEEKQSSVLLERFLKDSAAVAQVSGQDITSPGNAEGIGETSNIPEGDLLEAAAQRSVSFDMDGSSRQIGLGVPNEAPIGVVDSINNSHINNMSMNVEAPSIDGSLNVDHQGSVASYDPHHSAVPGSSQDIASINTDEPRFLRLTEADMLEMASIDEASIGNAPPSDREEVMSEIGELADMTTEAVSQDTPTTAMESTSQRSASLLSTSHVLPSISNNVGNFDTSAAPTSNQSNHSSLGDAAATDNPTAVVEPFIEANVALLGDSNTHHEDSPVTPINRRRRIAPLSQETPNSPAGSSVRAGYGGEDDARRSPVAGFDYDKDAPTSPAVGGGDDSFTELPLDAWSPQGKMHVSPLHPASRPIVSALGSPKVGDCLLGDQASQFPIPPLANRGGISSDRSAADSESEIDDIPPEITTHSGDEKTTTQSIEPSGVFYLLFQRAFDQLQGKVLKDGQVVSTSIAPCDVGKVLASPDLHGRFLASVWCLLLHLPLLCILVALLPNLFQAMGSSRFLLLMSFGFVSCSFSRSIMLQSSQSTQQAISSRLIGLNTFPKWCALEIMTACLLGGPLTLASSICVYLLSGADVRFCLAVSVGQMSSCVAAGAVGVFAPIVAELLPISRNTGFGHVPLATNLQDLLCSFCFLGSSMMFIGEAAEECNGGGCL